MKNLSNKLYQSKFVSTFPGDETGDLSSRQTPGMLFSKALPTPVKQPKLLAWSEDLALDLGIEIPNEEDINILGGNLIAPSMQPYAACYGGHQFGNWAGQLGDGRAITLGEWETLENKSWELQLKGAGPTAYSRNADGRAVLRSSVREYLMSEAMHYLGVPTTRALSIVATGDNILRDMFYNGNAAYEPGAVVMRISPSFLRFGSYQILTARNEMENLKNLVDWTIDKHYPHITGEDKVIKWFREVVEKTATLMVEWLRVGFVHGVMNTDNMSILGLTIDYGPFSFLDDYDPDFTPNTTDLPGKRYAFGRQASIAQWNLGGLAGALLPLIGDEELLKVELEAYRDLVSMKYYNMMGDKLGLDEVNAQDAALIEKLEHQLSLIKPDMTIFYQLLISLPLEIQNEEETKLHFDDCFYRPLNEEQSLNFFDWIKSYAERIKRNTYSREVSQKQMKASNPRFVLRNYLLHQSIEELEKGDNKLFKKLQEAIKQPYSDKFDEFFVKRPSWASEKAGCSMLSCSS